MQMQACKKENNLAISSYIGTVRPEMLNVKTITVTKKYISTLFH